MDAGSADMSLASPAGEGRLPDGNTYGRTIEQFHAKVFATGALEEKTKHLIGLAVHASPSLLDRDGVHRHMARLAELGVQPVEIAEVLMLVSPLGVHGFNVALPILEQELASLGREPPTKELNKRQSALKADFIEKRGFWPEHREALARLSPDVFEAFMDLYKDPWTNGVLTPKVKELISLAIDSAPSHLFEVGIRIHIRTALRLGASVDEIVEAIGIAGSVGVSAWTLGMDVLAEV